MESDITETGITKSVITSIFERGIGYNREMESTIMESGITESHITKKKDSCRTFVMKVETGITYKWKEVYQKQA